MIKTHRIFLLLFLTVTLSAQEAAPPPSEHSTPAPEPQTHPGAPYLELALEYVMAYDQLAALLKDVEDKPAAEVAAPDVLTVVLRLRELNERQRLLPAPTAAILDYVSGKLREVDIDELSERSMGKVIDLLTLADPPCYGATELTKALNLLVEDLLQGE